MEYLGQFWQVVKTVWQHGLLGVDVGRILVALAILLLFLVARRVLSRLVLSRLAAVARKTKGHWDDDLVESLRGPLQFVPAIFGVFLSLEYLNPTGDFAVFADKLLRSMVALAIFWGLSNLVRPILPALGRLERVFNAALLEWLVKASRALLIFIGGAIILEIWGIRVGPLLAGLGLFGAAVALGAKDLFSNLIGGLLVLGEKRFQPGDWIKVDGVVEGVVEQIGFRSTLVRRFDKAPVFVPNAKLADNAVTNFSRMTRRRIFWTIGLEYRASIDQLRRIRDGIEDYLRQNPAFEGPPEFPLFVRVDQFGASSIDLMLYCFTATRDWGEYLAIKEELALKVKDIVAQAGAGFAFPSRSIYLETLPEDAAEIFPASMAAPKPGPSQG